MNYEDPQITAVAEQALVKPTTPVKTGIALYECLVLSPSQTRREMLMEAACDGGWDTTVCDDVVTARSYMRRTRFRLALVDIEGYGDSAPDDYRDVCEQLASEDKELLVAVCGHDGDPREEIWARQLGVWLYLPGVVEGDDLANLCFQARDISDQLTSSSTPKAASA